MQAKDFEPHVGKRFVFEGGAQALTLTAVDLGPDSSGGFRRPFTLVFSGSGEGELLSAAIHRCAVEGGPEFELYVEPMQTFASDRQDYQAVFN